MPAILVVNAGSTNLKLHLVAEDEQTTKLDGLGDAAPGMVDAVAHRVVHGGHRFHDPVVIDTAIHREIYKLEELAPLHNAPALAAIDEAVQAFPHVPQIAVFDTAFHATIPTEASVYAIPSRWREEWHIRRYGFHGLSVAWCAERVPALLSRPTHGLRMVVCHLGGGCSVTAIRDGRSVDTTMGFSPLDGVPMMTRSGSVDPEALLYLLRTRRIGLDALDHALNLESGLKALSEGLASMLAIEQAASAGNEAAQLAMDVFVHRVAGAVAAMAVAAGGIDALAFTAGIGEHSSTVRARVCRLVDFLGVQLDQARNENARGDAAITTNQSAVDGLVVRAREEIIAARAARSIL